MLSIIVPYRDREVHLAEFIPNMNKYLPDAKIIIVEQDEGKPFNRGRLINIGFLNSDRRAFVAHDIDMLPISVRYDFHVHQPVAQLAGSEIQYYDYLGGVTLFHPSFFMGYHNDYFHRAEDNEMMFNLKRQNIPVTYRTGTFQILPHPRTGPEFDPELWKLAQVPRTVNMLETCTYELVQDLQYDTHRHIKVKF